MNKRFTLDDIENFLLCKLEIEWVNRTIFSEKVKRYKRAEIADFDSEGLLLKLRIKGKEDYRKVYINDDNFYLQGKIMLKNLSKDWNKYLDLSNEL